jgi:hypothetical protein
MAVLVFDDLDTCVLIIESPFSKRLFPLLDCSEQGIGPGSRASDGAVLCAIEVRLSLPSFFFHAPENRLSIWIW